jgi:hypothetical protein
MKGTDKQIAWATQIINRYEIARATVMEMASKLPAANKEKIEMAIAAIDKNITHNNDAGDIISRSGYAYFINDDESQNLKALKEAVMSIAKGNDNVLTQK